MPDPLEQLRSNDDPVAPRDEFRWVLRRRVVEAHVPVVDRVVVGRERELRFLARFAAPVVHELVAGHADEPRLGEVGHTAAADGVDRGHERLRREVLGHRRRPAALDEVAVHPGEGAVVEHAQGDGRVGGGLGGAGV